MNHVHAFILRIVAAAIPPVTSRRYPNRGLACSAGELARLELQRKADALDAEESCR